MSPEQRNLRGIWRWVSISFTVIAIFFAINQIFGFQFFSGHILLGKSFQSVIVALILPLIFLHFPLKKEGNFFWFDIVLFFVCWASFLYLAWHGYEILVKGYGYSAPIHMILVAILLWVLLIEALRRGAGPILTIVVLFFSIYPIFATYMPGILNGISFSFNKTATFHILSNESAMGTLTDTFVNIVLGYIVFGEAMVATGGGKFLLNLTNSVVGKTRGGPAKIAVIASGLFGSVNGSPIVNVITTGSMTIPAMKSIGYESYYAGAIESVASTAGTFTPPIMGATAFVMASFINIPYASIALAAAIPAFLFYFTLFIAVDGHAAKMELLGKLKRTRKEEIIPLWEIFKDGWFYLPTLLVLIYFLFIMRWIGEAPYIATAIMLVLAQVRKNSRLKLDDFLHFLEKAGESLAVLLAIMIGAGFLLGSFSLTGIASSFCRELFSLAGDNVLLMLTLAAMSSLILGMGMSVIACYIFLALIVAPALISAGLNVLSVHLFLLYYGMLSSITPPVALCAFTAANIAKAPPIKIAVTACRLGVTLFILPFFFVLRPALLLQGEPTQFIYAFITVGLGLGILSSAFEGYLLGIGDVQSDYLFRGVLIISAIGLSVSGWKYNLIGAGVLLLALLIKIRIQKRILRVKSYI